MTQNRSHAVMAQRAEPDDSLDDFPTPPWATRALLTHVIQYDYTNKDTALDPAANRGFMVRPLKEQFAEVFAGDVHDYGVGFPVKDFLFPGTYSPGSVDWVITNPPFRLAEQFVMKALTVSRCGVAILARTVFIESAGRYESLFRPQCPNYVAPFVERVPMVKGRVDKKASTATSYSWLVWLAGSRPRRPELVWIPPCRGKLERKGDYDLRLPVS